MNKRNRQIYLNKADQIFDWLLANKKMKWKGKHNIPSSNELKTWSALEEFHLYGDFGLVRTP